MRKFLIIPLMALALLTGCGSPGSVSIPPDTTLIALRHTERDGDLLSERGHARAAALPDALAGVQIDAIYSPGLERNLQTAAPLAAATGLDVTRIPPVGAVNRIMAEQPGRTVVWVGNKGNLTEIWTTLGAPGDPPLTYGEVFTLTRGALGAVKVETGSFGAPPVK